MKATELRIGNLVAYNSDKISVTEILPLWIESDYDPYGYIEYDKLEPIPLTEEWLLKFGFVEIYRSILRKTFELPLAAFFGYSFWYSFEYYENKQGDAIYYGRYLKCEYVHQLQNLYFALTGEELEAKP